jgi:hypothetical protein
MKTEKLHSKLVSCILVMSIMALSVSMNAQVLVTPPSSSGTTTTNNDGTYSDGLMRGQIEAKGNALWLLAGFGCNCLGVLAAYMVKPNPPTYALVGKSSDYVMGYTEGYQKKSKNKNANYAWLGCAANALVSIALSPSYYY